MTIEYLTIQHFGKHGDNGGEGVVNHDSGHGWLIQYNTVQQSAGAGVFIGTDGTTRYNCLRQNGEYGFQSGGGAHGAAHEVLDHNEISGNNTDDWEKRQPGCGCSGAGKFWDTNGANVTNNWIHDNRGPGPWMDTDNNDFNVEGNLIDGNQAEGLIYEISYNALIKNNTFVRNAIVAGPKNPGFPTPAIYLSESGGDGRVAGRYSTIEVTNNRFVDNWAGIVLWENADRFCNSPANSSSGYCTLVDPKVVNLHTCVRGKIKGEPYYSDCRWKTQNVEVSTTISASTRPISRIARRRCRADCRASSPTGAPTRSGRPTRATSSSKRSRSRKTTYLPTTRTRAHGCSWRTTRARSSARRPGKRRPTIKTPAARSQRSLNNGGEGEIRTLRYTPPGFAGRGPRQFKTAPPSAPLMSVSRVRATKREHSQFERR